MYAGAAVGLIALGAFFGGPGFARIPLFSRGNNDVDGLTVELRKYRPVADVVGVVVRTGEIVLRLGIDANELPSDDLIRLFYGFTKGRSN
jgi:hypothetical protein